MKLFKKEPNFKFMSKRIPMFLASGLVILIGIVLFIFKDFNLGIDFTGGTLIEVSFKNEMSVGDLRSKLQNMGLGKSIIQRIGTENKFFIKTERMFEQKENAESGNAERVSFANEIKKILMTEEEKQLSATRLDLNDVSEKGISDFLVSKGVVIEDAEDAAKKIVELTTKDSSGLIADFAQISGLDIKERVKSVLKDNAYLGSFTFLSTETVGPQVGHDMRGKVTRASIYALIGMLIYIGFRFQFLYGLAGVVTLFHDVLITLTFILVFNVEVNLSVIAAILTIVGYSINDTIVIFDRLRDNVKSMRKESPEIVLDMTINQTLSRTINTAGTTLLTVVALFLFGGEVLRAFSFTLLVGISIGTYSSIFQSCSWLLVWEKKVFGPKKKLK